MKAAPAQTTKAVKPTKARPARRSFWWRTRRRVRQQLTWEHARDVLRTLVWVAPLTLLVWGLAERERVATETPIVRVDVTSQDKTRNVRRLGPPDRTLRLEGPRSGLDRVLTQLQGGVTIELPAAVAVGEREVEVAGEVNRLPMFVDAGVTVVSASPATMTVDVDEKIDRGFEVALPRELADDPSLQAVFSPPSVLVNGPRGVLGDAGLTLAAEVRRQDMPAAGASAELPAVPLRLRRGGEPLQDLAVTLAQPTVTATLRRADAPRREHVIGSMVLRVSKPAVNEGEWRVQTRTNLTNVKVAGPADAVGRIVSGAFTPVATLDVPPGPTPGVRRRGPVRLALPEGVEVVGPPPEVEYEVVSLEPGA